MPFCPKCGNQVGEGESYCPSCGAQLHPDQGQGYQTYPGYQGQEYQAPHPGPRKSPGIAAVLALVLGFFGLFGIGHIYAGRARRGVVLLVIGIVIALLIWPSLFLGAITLGAGFIVTVALAIAWLVLWIWQTYDAYVTAERYNRSAGGW